MKGLNEFISLAIIMALSMSAILISIEFIKPVIEKSYDNFVVNEAVSNIAEISNIIKQISTEGEGSKRTINIRVSKGIYIFDDISDTINFTYKINSNLVFSGYKNGIHIKTENGEIKIFTKIDKIDFTNKFYLTNGNNVFVLNYDNFDDGVIKLSIST